MSTRFAWLRRLLAALVAPSATPSSTETLSLHDWADLPVYHPNCDAASN
jgi:hypothetical protein